MIDIAFGGRHKPYKIGEYKLVQQEFFNHWIYLMERTWYGWKSVGKYASWEAANLDMKARQS
jgi:hypothetical protein